MSMKPDFDKHSSPPYFTQIGNGSKRPYRACKRVGKFDWILLGTYPTLQEANERLARERFLDTHPEKD